MAMAMKPALARVSYEELIIDILITKSIVFSVVGLDVPGLAWAHRLVENGYATIGIHGRRPVYEMPIVGKAQGILQLGTELEEIAVSDVILNLGEGGFAGVGFQALLPHLRRGQVVFTHAGGGLDLALERRMVEEAAKWGLAIGRDFFVVYIPEKGLPVSHPDDSAFEMRGVTDVCSRVGNAIYTNILRCLD